jgi:hypothetical protein
VVASAWAGAVTTGMLQKAGGAFTLTADANFGASFGLLSLYFCSQASNPASSASTQVVRLASSDTIAWRNNANSADIRLGKNTSDQLSYAGTAFLSSSGVILAAGFPALTGDVTTSSGSLATTVANIQGTTVSGTTGSTNVVFSASPTFTGTVLGASATWSGVTTLGTTSVTTAPLIVKHAITSGNGGAVSISRTTDSADQSFVVWNGSGGTNQGYIGFGANSLNMTIGVANALAATFDTSGNFTAYNNITATNGVFSGNGSSLTTLNASNLSSGTVAAARMPALTGDVTTSAGAVATSLVATTNSTLTTISSLVSVGTITTGTWAGTTISTAHGGTGQTSLNSTVFTTLFETIATTLGDLVYGGASGAPTRLAGQTSNAQAFLGQTESGGTAAAPAWVAATGSGNVVMSASPTFTGTIVAANIAPTGLLDISASGAGQIKFPSSQNASSNANTLDDYSRGTFTPTLSSWTNVGGAPTVTGYYVKVGSIVTIIIYIVPVTSSASVAGTSTITGLPYTATDKGVALTTDNNVTSYGTGLVTGTTIYPPNITATNAGITITATYISGT